MKRNLLIGAMLLIGVSTYAQKDNVGIGTTKPEQSAILDVNSTNKGLLMPRMSLQQRNAIQSPAKGLIVYQTDLLSGFYFYDGTEWKSLGNNTSEKSVAGTDGDWTLIGNTGLTAGTNFIGADIPLEFRSNYNRAGLLDNVKYNVFFGGVSGNSITTGSFNSGIGYGALNANTTGASNLAFGSGALFKNTTASNNMAIGGNALRENTIGEYNSAVGSLALQLNTTGSYNTAFGSAALYGNTTGSNNIGIGQDALKTTGAGSRNIGIGYKAGELAAGNDNMFLGYQAGANETGNSKLYIAGSNTTTPLVYGSFSADFIAIGGVDATPAKRDNLAASYGLLVKKGILTEKIKVATMTTTDWADYVFEKDYKKLSLEDVEAFIKENKHLPNVPTTQEMMSNGNDLMKTDAKLLEKIEELTLYIIELNKKVKTLENNNTNK